MIHWIECYVRILCVTSDNEYLFRLEYAHLTEIISSHILCNHDVLYFTRIIVVDIVSNEQKVTIMGQRHNQWLSQTEAQLFLYYK